VRMRRAAFRATYTPACGAARSERVLARTRGTAGACKPKDRDYMRARDHARAAAARSHLKVDDYQVVEPHRAAPVLFTHDPPSYSATQKRCAEAEKQF
jgi:hypothetical protein